MMSSQDLEDYYNQSKLLSWHWVTGDQLLEEGACEVIFASLSPSAAAAEVTIYDGRDTSGNKVVTLVASTKTNQEFKPRFPVYCSRGLYIDVGSNVTGILIQYKRL